MKTFKAAVLGLFIIGLILFVVQNLKTLSQGVSLKFDILLASFDTPAIGIGFLITLCFAGGFLLSLAVGYPEKRRLKKTIKGVRMKLARTEEELNSLRNLPITGDHASPPPSTTPARPEGV